MCVTEEQEKQRWGRGVERRVKPEERTENFVFLFSMSVTRVTPGLYVNTAKKPPGAKLSFLATARPLLPVTLTRTPHKDRPGHPNNTQASRPLPLLCPIFISLPPS